MTAPNTPSTTDAADGSRIDLAATLSQLAEDLEKLENFTHRVNDSLRRRGLEMGPGMTDAVNGMRQSLERARRQGEDLINQSARLQQTVRASARITTSLELDRVLGEVMESVIALSGAERAYLMLLDDETGELLIRATHHWDSDTASGDTDDTDVAFSRSVVREAFEKREPILTMNALNDSRFHDKQSIVGLALRSVLCVPLVIDQRVLGVLYADNRLRSGVFTKGTVELLAAFGTQAAIAIEKARLHGEELRRVSLEKDLSVARDIQFSLLPKAAPVIEGWQFTAFYEPARVVGGDFYDFFSVGGKQGIVISDVADKGVGAALFMGMGRSTIRAAALSADSPAQALGRANSLIIQDSGGSDLFLSVFYALIDPLTGTVLYTNAGHNPPIIYRAEERTFESLPSHGMVLGIFEDIVLSDSVTQLNPGDVLVFYTDGITEAMNEEGELFTENALRDAIASAADEGAEEIRHAITDALRAHTRGAAQSDDMTLVIARRLK